MCGKIDCFITAFSSLSIEKDRKQWPAETTFRAPHKPLLLLSILDLVAQGKITRNFVEPNFELAESFAGYWQRVMPNDSHGNITYPFISMKSEPFWVLVPRPDFARPSGKVFRSIKRVRELYLGARLDEQLYPLLLMEPLRRRLKEALVQTYFDSKVHPLLFEQDQVNIQTLNR